MQTIVSCYSVFILYMFSCIFFGHPDNNDSGISNKAKANMLLREP